MYTCTIRNVGNGLSVSINLELNLDLSLSVAPDSSRVPCSNACCGRDDGGAGGVGRTGSDRSDSGVPCARAAPAAPPHPPARGSLPHHALRLLCHAPRWWVLSTSSRRTLK